MFSADFQYRSDLPLSKRDWAIRSFQENPQGGWTAGTNPGRFVPLQGYTRLNGGVAIPDPGCRTLGLVLTNPTANGFSICRAQFTPWDNLIDKQWRAQFYGEVRSKLTDSIEFHVDGLFAITEAPSPNRSPSFTVSREGACDGAAGRHHRPEHIAQPGDAGRLLRARHQSRFPDDRCGQSDLLAGR